jgi:poly(3-hydroxyalkanoate) depolymerase
MKPNVAPAVRVVDVAGTEVRVVIRGDGPPLLMLNGIGGHVGMWEPLVADLSRTRSLVLFDVPGAGSTAPLARPPRMPGLARFVTRVLDEIGLDRVDTLGYSWGGALAQQLAHDAPERVRRLVLVATTPGYCGQPPHPRVAAAMLSPRRFLVAGETRKIASRLYGGDYRHGKPVSRSALRNWNARPPTLRGYSHQLYAISGWTSTPWLHRLRQPTLIISGDDDPLAPAFNARLMAGLIRNSRLHMVAGGGHLWLLDHADVSVPLIEEFLART